MKNRRERPTKDTKPKTRDLWDTVASNVKVILGILVQANRGNIESEHRNIYRGIQTEPILVSTQYNHTNKVSGARCGIIIANEFQ